MAKRLAELGALQDAVSNDESSPKRLALAGYIRGLFLDWSANPYNPLSRLTARGRLLGYFWDSGAIGLSMNFADQNYLVKDGTVQSKSFSQIVNFSRTTNATVTNSDGLITYAPHNLLTFSEQFDNAAWVKTNSTISANSATSPNQTITADLHIPNNGSNVGGCTVYQANTMVSGLSYTISFYAKSNGGIINTIAGFDGRISGSSWVTFTLSGNGSYAIQGSSWTASIAPVGNGWYRCTMTGTSTLSATSNTILYTGGVTTVTGDGTSGIYIWGAQLEIGSTATTYNSTTVKNQLGFSEAFDNAAWTKSNSFVQTNLLTYSEAFDNAAWSKANGTSTSPVVTANNAIAPNGYQTADSISFGAIDAAGDFSVISQVITLASTANHTRSVYVKATTVSDVGKKLYFYVTDGVLKDVVTITLTSEWQRVTKTLSMASGPAKSFTLGTLGSTYGGENQGVVSADVWGFQVVQGDVAGDYRRTDAAALPVYYPNHNGVVCAEKLVENTATNEHRISLGSLTTTANPWTASVYAKAGERNFVWIRYYDSGVVQRAAWFNLATGEVGTVGTGVTGTIQSVGNGFYRCASKIASAFAGTTNTVEIGVSNTNAVTSYTGDGTSGIYIFGAQLSDSASLDPYVLNAAAAPTAAAYYGPRFDYDPVTLQPKGLLIEEQRSNLLLQSADFSTTWSLSGCKAFGSGSTVNATTAPDGSLSADLITPTAGGGHLVTQTATVVSGASYTTTVYAKPAGYTWILLWSSTGSAGAYFDVANGIIGTVSSGVTATITKVLNGFYRCSITRTTASTTEAVACFVAQSNGVFSYTSDETSGIYLWGAQLEAGAFATSYIPTAASQVTRAADVATIQGSNFYSWYNQNEGTIACSVNVTTAQSTSLFEISGASGNDIIAADYSNGAISQFRALIRTNGTLEMIQNNGSTKTTGIYKYALAYKTNDCAFTISGDSVLTDSAVNLPILSKITLVARPASAATYGTTTIQSLSYCPQRLSNDVLKGLTA